VKACVDHDRDRSSADRSGLCVERYHQQYLSDTKNPNGYRGPGATGVSCPVGVATLDD
jgi:peptide-methionine (S)-S-oxide reductase